MMKRGNYIPKYSIIDLSISGKSNNPGLMLSILFTAPKKRQFLKVLFFLNGFCNGMTCTCAHKVAISTVKFQTASVNSKKYHMNGSQSYSHILF